jgi:hypothetical protein
MVPAVNCDDTIQTIQATGVSNITSFGDRKAPLDIENRFPMMRETTLETQPAGNVNMLLGLNKE